MRSYVHEFSALLLTCRMSVSPLLVGQDCYTRIWSLRDTHLLRTIPSPHPTSRTNIPSVAFSSRLGGVQGAPGLLMAVQQDLYYYPYS